MEHVRTHTHPVPVYICGGAQGGGGLYLSHSMPGNTTTARWVLH